MCFADRHTFSWGSSAAGDAMPLRMWCDCGVISREDIDPIGRLRTENARLRTALAPIMAYLEAVVRLADPDGNRWGDKLAAVNDVWLLRSDIERLRDALAAPRSAD